MGLGFGYISVNIKHLSFSFHTPCKCYKVWGGILESLCQSGRVSGFVQKVSSEWLNFLQWPLKLGVLVQHCGAECPAKKFGDLQFQLIFVRTASPEL